MLRRAGRFQRSKRILSPPSACDIGDVLQRKWFNWLEQESWKRLAFHAFIMDAQSSMALSISPIISFSELTISLPETRELWLAENAEQWKALYLARPSLPQQRQQDPGLVDFLRDPIEIPAHYDVHFSRLIILHGIWGMIWQYLQLQATLKKASRSHAANTLRHQEILQMLQLFRMNTAESQIALCPKTRMVIELQHMYLHMSLEEIELFAGKGDLEDARQVLPSLQQWVESSESRQALWHAGQVIASAKVFYPKSLRGFFAIATYHACLTMWAHSIISYSKATSNEVPLHASHLEPKPVCLDGPDSTEMQRYIALGRGIPSITSLHTTDVANPTPIPLSDQENVIAVVRETLTTNSTSQLDGEGPPPLIENLNQLLRDLGRAGASVGT